MDIEFARTFLAVAAARNFVGAAERLHITQSTVSARIQTLENQLGVKLFRRGRGGAELTAAGQRFLRHAKILVQTLEQARHDVGLPEGFHGSLTLNGRIALWEGFLPRWVRWMRDAAPDTSLRMEIGFEEGIMQGLVEGTIDVGVMYAPESRPGLGVERLFEETLLLVSSDPARPWPDPGYIHIDWGPEFFRQFTTHYPDVAPAALTANIGSLGRQYLLKNGGAGYFPIRLVRELLEQNQVWRIADSPVFRLPVYMVYPLDQRSPTLAKAIEGLRLLAAEERRLAP